MILQKPLPDTGEILLVKISKIMPHGAYCELVEYDASAYLPISEVASGWIKNIHERIKEGQKDVAKVIFVDAGRKAIDVSLKKVTTKEKKDKINEYTLEKRAEKFFTQALSAVHKESKLEEFKRNISQSVSTYTDLLDLIYEKRDEKNLLDDDVRAALFDIITKNMKPKVYSVSYMFELTAINGKGGMSIIKKAYEEIEKLGVEVLYEGAPHYKVTAKGPSYIVAENKIKDAQLVMQKYANALTVTVKK